MASVEVPACSGELKERLSGIFPTCEEGMVVEAPLLILMGADIK